MITMALWWFTTLIIITFYKSSVLSAMVYPPNLEPENLEQLISHGYRIASNVHYQDVAEELLNVNDSVYRHALHQALYADGPCETFALTLNGGVAMLDELSEIQYELRAICPQYDVNTAKKYRIARKSIRATGHGWALQKDAPYRQAIDFYFSLILSGGLFKKWINDETLKGASKLFKRSREIILHEVEILSLARFQPVLVIYCCGIGVSLICFLIEYVIFHTKKKR